MANLNEFMNDKYKLLFFIFSHQVNIKEEHYAPLSQQEIADGVGFSKLKANKLIAELKENDYLTSYHGKNSKYQVTELGKQIIQKVNEEISSGD